MKALIDGDVLVYACGFAAEKKVYTVYYEDADGEMRDVEFENAKQAKEFQAENGGELIPTTRVQPLGFAIKNVMTLLDKIKEATGATSYEIFLTGKSNFRDELVDYYKANRDPTHKPVHYKAIKEWLINKRGAVVVEGYEADDAMSILQYARVYMQQREDNGLEDPYSTEDTVICTIDKDLDQVPSWHYNWQKDTRYFVTQKGGLEFFYTQMLTGDSTDNIPGVFKLTGKKATAKMKEGLKDKSELEMWNYVKEQYGPDVPEEKLIEIARLLWMMRTPTDVWEPPSEPSVPHV